MTAMQKTAVLALHSRSPMGIVRTHTELARLLGPAAARVGECSANCARQTQLQVAGVNRDDSITPGEVVS